MTNTNQDSTTSLPACHSIASGIVTAILRDKNAGSLPHAVLVKFDGHIGMLRAKDMDGDAAERLKNIARFDMITAMVTSAVIDSDGKPCIDLSEKSLTTLTDLFELPGSHVVGRVVKVTTFGAFVDIGNGFPTGLCHTSELAAVNQKKRLRQLKIGDRLSVGVMSVKPDPDRPGKFLVALSELQHYLTPPLWQCWLARQVG
jgi:hypothetical protein